jgi:hypothetical protein
MRTPAARYLYELVEIADGLAASAMELEESMICEPEFGYTGELYFHGSLGKQ